MLQINQIVLVQKVVHFLVHAFDYMVSHDLVFLWSHLENVFLFVVGKVPGNNTENIFLVIHGYNLELVLENCFNDFDHLCGVTELGMHLLHWLIFHLLYDIIHLNPGCTLSLFLIGD